MKSHRKARASNRQQLLKLRFRLNVAHLRSVADAMLQQHWTFWQEHHVNRATIEYTLSNLVFEEQRKDDCNIDWRLTSEELDALASHVYDAWQNKTKEGVI